MLKTFESLTEFLDRAAAVPKDRRETGSADWFGQTWAETMECSKRGDSSRVPDAEKLLDKLTDTAEIRRPQWEPCVAGGFVCVPEFLSGEPECMRYQEQVVWNQAPVRLYVSTTSSAAVTASVMAKRGTAILALVLKLQQFRHVTLNLLAETYGATDGELVQVIPVESQPLNLSVACHVLSNVSFARRLTYSTARDIDRFNGAWPTRYGGGGAEWQGHVRRLLNLSPDDLYIGAATAWDEMVLRPVEWVNREVARLSQTA